MRSRPVRPRPLAPRAAALVAAAASAVAAASADAQGVPAPRAAGAASAPAAPAACATGPRDGAWETLFDGRGPTPLAAWRGFRRDDVPPAWRVADGALAVVPRPELARIGRTAHGDLVTRATYGDFELAFEWRIARGGNGGVLYRVAETDSATWMTGPEFQLLDDAHHANGRVATHEAGAIFGLVAPPAGVARPAAGAEAWTPWQRGRVVVRGWQVCQYLGGRLVAALDLASPAGRAAVAAAPFGRMPRFAAAAEGRIALQDMGDAVAFRRVRVRRLAARGPAAGG